MSHQGNAASSIPSAPDPDERELIARIRAGDEAAFETLFVTHYEGMCALAYMLVRSRDAAEDIVANIFRNLWKIRRDWAPTGPARTYLLTATRNEALNLLDRIRRERALEDRIAREDLIPAFGAPAVAPDDLVETRELTDAIERAVVDLSPRVREVFQLRWHEGLKYRQIADRLGISVKTVEMHMTAALREIRARLGQGS